MNKIISYLKDTLANFAAIFLQIPSKRFDKINNQKTRDSDIFHSEYAKIIECVTKKNGKARYRGVVWNARIESNNPDEYLEPGDEAKIKEIKGNILLFQSRPNQARDDRVDVQTP